MPPIHIFGFATGAFLLQVDGELSANSRASIVGGNLTIASLVTEDAGRYECVASNTVASTIASTVLLVERK